MQWDAEYERVVAEYAAGRDVAELERQYGLSRAEIEWLVSYQAQQRLARPSAGPAGEGQRSSTRPPAAVIGAAGVLGLGVVLGIGMLILGIWMQSWGVAVGVFIGVIFGAVVHGLWQGRRGAMIAAILLSLPMLPLGAVPIVLLLAPRSATAWFADGRRPVP